jgi:tetratricopeptide (TPR) repeat protein
MPQAVVQVTTGFCRGFLSDEKQQIATSRNNSASKALHWSRKNKLRKSECSSARACANCENQEKGNVMKFLSDILRTSCLVIILNMVSLASALVSDWEKAVSLYTQGQYQAAIAEFQNVINEFPNHADSWKYIGLAYFQLKQYEQAIAPLEKARALKQAEGVIDPDIPGVLGRIEISRKNYEAAQAILSEAVKSQPDSAANFYMLGVCYSNLNRTDDAMNAFRAALKIDPKDADSWYYLGILQVRAERPDDAIATLRQGVNAAPRHVEMSTLLVESLLRRSTTESNERKMLTLVDEAIRTASVLNKLRDDAATTELLGRAYLAAKKYTNAEMTLSRALAMNKQPTATLYFNLGFAHAQNKAWTRAAEMLEKADKLNPGDLATLTYLGYVNESLRRYPQALDAYSRAYEASGRANAELKASIDRVTPFARPQ